MTRRLLAATFLALCASLVVAPTASYAAYVLQVTVNADRSVTVAWALGSTDLSNVAFVVDCCVVRTWVNGNRSTRFTTAPLSAGRHTIAIQVLERYWTNTYYEPTSCDVSTRESFRFVCFRTTWTAPMKVLIPSSRDASCVVPMVAGLRLRDAKARITTAHCALGTVTRKYSHRALGTVLDQRPRKKMRLAKGAMVTLVISKGASPA